jgi:hypothetical protein
MTKKPVPYKVEPYYSMSGPIPDDHWENEMTAPTPIESFMSKKDIERFRAETERLRAEANKPAKKSGDQ